VRGPIPASSSGESCASTGAGWSAREADVSARRAVAVNPTIRIKATSGAARKHKRIAGTVVAHDDPRRGGGNSVAPPTGVACALTPMAGPILRVEIGDLTILGRADASHVCMPRTRVVGCSDMSLVSY